jgi:hypothetical protein
MSYQSIPTTATTAPLAASSEEGGEQPLEFSLSPQESTNSSDGDDNNDRSRTSRPRRGGAIVMAVASAMLLLLILAFFSGQSFSSSMGYGTKYLDDIMNNNARTDNVPNRLCEIYHDLPSSYNRMKKDKSSTAAGNNNVVVRSLIETSLGQPSQPWREVPCIHRYNNLHRGARAMLLPSLLSSFFSSSTATSSSSSSSSQKQRRQSSSEEEDEDYSNPSSSDTTTSTSSSSQQRPSAIINVDFSSIVFPNRPPILGFGGAFTEASALNFWSLNEKGRKAALELLFGKNGLGYR